jgi:tetratricopeptide (TPR) repeat protein/predicted aspartyl protease
MPREPFNPPDSGSEGEPWWGRVIGFARPPMACALLAWTLLAATAAHAEPCRITRTPDIPVTMSGLRPMVRAQINGQDAWLVVDSGAFFSILTPAAVQQFQLPYQSFPGLYVEGVGGHESARVVRVRKFTLIGITWDDVEFVVAGSSFGSEAAGLLGQNVLHIADVEYDLANGVIRLVRPKGDCKRMALAYWADAAGKPYSVIDIASATVREPHTRSVAYLNGVKIRVTFDTGAAQSLLALGAAKRAGITPSSPGVTDGGYSHGLGHKVTRTWITRFASFKIGDEEVQHAQLRFGDVDLVEADMLIGADFFLSHRVYVASSQNRLYFTYNGGPVFDLSATREPAEAAGAEAGSGTSAEPSAPDAAMRLDEPTDAAGFARRGAASDAPHDYDAAIADLTRACELAPAESSYFYQRGVAHGHKGQGDAALADFDQAIKLQPDNADALVGRASLRASRQAPAAEVTTDLEAADRALPKQADMRLDIGKLYESIGQPAAAVIEYSKWIDSHPRDNLLMPGTFDSRCRSRALSGQELGQALADCNAALRMKPNTAAFLDSRGLVHLRQNDYDQAIADYDAALHLQPKIAWSLYGRGLARLHKGLTAEGQADIAAATALQPKIAEHAATYGITP